MKIINIKPKYCNSTHPVTPSSFRQPSDPVRVSAGHTWGNANAIFKVSNANPFTWGYRSRIFRVVVDIVKQCG